MNRLEAIRIMIGMVPDEDIIFHANGAISRESYHTKDRKRNFYLLGSMGLPAAVALGAALALPQRKIIVLDGDGNLLMGFGNLALVGALRPANLLHVVLDNGVYGTTGDQPTISPLLALSDIARASGYRSVQEAGRPGELLHVFPGTLAHRGPHFIHVRVSREVDIQVPRIPYSAREMKERFIAALADSPLSPK
jgi:thiamine pyrophosphate-dependent acetolactate synthase large subunit-like protein